MSKKSLSKSNKSPKSTVESEFMGQFSELNEEAFAGMMDDAMLHATKTIQAEQTLALELTKLAVAHTANPDENTVYELFRRSVKEIEDIYGSDMEDMF